MASKYLNQTTKLKLGFKSSNCLDQMSFLLSVFDNIVGPKIVHYWTVSEPLNDDLIKYISLHTLNSELYQDKLHDQIKFRLYLIKEIDCAIFSIFFDSNTINSTNANSSFLNTNCLSLILPLDNKDFFLKYYGDGNRFFVNIFENIVIEFKILCHIKPKCDNISTAIQDLTLMIENFCTDLYTLNRKCLFPLNSKSDNQFNSKIQTKFKIKDTYLSDLYFTTPTLSSINNEFLVNSITSHLITNFNTIVLGKTSVLINKMINTLALFMPNEKLKISCYCLQDTNQLSPYFCLQGLVTEFPDDFGSVLDTDFLFKKDSPTTIIDLSLKQVYRTTILNDFYAQKETFVNKKCQFLLNSLTISDLNSVYKVNTCLHWISSVDIINKSNLLSQFLKQMEILESDFGVQDSYLDMFLKDLYMLALNLIEYLNNQMVNSSNKKEKQLRISSKTVQRDLDIKSEEDLNILLAYSNYLKPGLLLDIKLN